MDNVTQDHARGSPEDGRLAVRTEVLKVLDTEDQVADESIDQESQSDLGEDSFLEAAHC